MKQKGRFPLCSLSFVVNCFYSFNKNDMHSTVSQILEYSCTHRFNTHTVLILKKLPKNKSIKEDAML